MVGGVRQLEPQQVEGAKGRTGGGWKWVYDDGSLCWWKVVIDDRSPVGERWYKMMGLTVVSGQCKMTGAWAGGKQYWSGPGLGGTQHNIMGADLCGKWYEMMGPQVDGKQYKTTEPVLVEGGIRWWEHGQVEGGIKLWGYGLADVSIRHSDTEGTHLEV